MKNATLVNYIYVIFVEINISKLTVRFNGGLKNNLKAELKN